MNEMKLTTAQFAKLHKVNRRTLHYYDTIGLFSPKSKGENGYRYYELSQSVEFEYIRMLKELHMSIEEIQTYLEHPTPEKFLKIAEQKEFEIDQELKRLKQMKKLLKVKKEQVYFCENLKEQEIRIEECREEKIRILPYDFAEEEMEHLFAAIKDVWSIEQIRMGIGSVISLEKIEERKFEVYDGIYTPILCNTPSEEVAVKPRGNYLCGYQRGRWENLPYLYEKMMEFAKDNQLKLTGYAYEIGMNEFAISDLSEYVTKIMIQIRKDGCATELG